MFLKILYLIIQYNIAVQRATFNATKYEQKGLVRTKDSQNAKTVFQKPELGPFSAFKKRAPYGGSELNSHQAALWKMSNSSKRDVEAV